MAEQENRVRIDEQDGGTLIGHEAVSQYAGEPMDQDGSEPMDQDSSEPTDKAGSEPMDPGSSDPMDQDDTVVVLDSSLEKAELPNDTGALKSSTEVVALLRRRGLLPTGCCYDARMKLHVNADFHTGPQHPEDPRRIEEIFKAFKLAGLIYTGPEEDLPEVIVKLPTRYMWRIAARQATRDEICTVHLQEHYEWVAGLADKSYAELREISAKLDSSKQSLYVGSLSFLAALLSAGGAIDTCKQVVEGNVKNAFAVIRPPGHHAEYDSAMGFCFFNNVPVAVKICQAEYAERCRKVLIVDWDVHHGNGTQNIFYHDPNVLYISIHVYQNGEFYPGQPDNPLLPDGGPEHCGSGAGLGKNVNIGWHSQGMGDGEYMAAFQKIVMPIAQEFNPDLVVVSAGFDAADGDELGGCFVTPACYAHMTHMLMSLADGKVAICLEGGYDLTAISNSAVAVARSLMGEPPPKIEIPGINRDAARLLAKVQAYQAPYWECMRPGVVDVLEAQSANASRLHDVIRASQRLAMQKHLMIPLYIQRDFLFKSYENQVLVSPRLDQCRRILVIIHDPPTLVAQADAVDGTVEAHNTWVIDSVSQFVDWAVGLGFGIMDINIPMYVTREQDVDPFIHGVDEAELESQIQELVCYLWDNYLQLYDKAQDIFIMGVGESHVGVKALLTNRACKTRIRGIVNFVAGRLRSIKSTAADPDLTAWYRNNSRIYVSENHQCWTNEEQRARVQKRRFGAVIRSSTSGLHQMMQAHAHEAQEWMLALSVSVQGDTTEKGDGASRIKD